MHYSALTSYSNGEIDRSWVSLKTSDKELLAPADERSIHFDYWGWSETAKSGGIVAQSQTITLDTDIFLVYLRFTNNGTNTITGSPAITFYLETGEMKNENMMMGSVPSSPVSRCTYDAQTNTVSIANTAQEFFFQQPSLENPAATTNIVSNISVVRVIAPGFEIETATSSGLLQSYTHTITGKPVTINSKETYETYYVIGVDQSMTAETDGLLGSAKQKAVQGREKVGKNPCAAITNIISDWTNFFDSLPVPHTEKQAFTELYYMAASALRMGLYAPRNAMTQWCSVPCKPHFNLFWCWDTPFHTVGQSEFGRIFGTDGTDLAEQNMYTQFTGQNPATGMIYIVVDDSFTSMTPMYSQPPVHGWTIPKVYEQDLYRNPQRAREFIQSMYDVSSKYMDFWSLERDTNFDGLFEYNSAMETGWDDTPRYTIVNPSGTNLFGFMPMAGVDAIDLNSWLYIYMNSLSSWANNLGDAGAAEQWKEKADNLASLVEERMWCEDDKAWYDLNHISGSYEFVKVMTPAIWFPAFAGLSKNETRIRSVIERHLLNPEEFFGKYPIPTVAYNSEYYNHESDGYYWRGQIWLITAYITLETLYKYGYETEAQELKNRLLEMMSNKGGIYETYNAKTGEVGWGSGGVGCPTAFQFGWSSTFAIQMILDRYQRVRYVMSNDTGFSGYVKDAYVLETGAPFYSIETGEYEVPFVDLQSTDGKPLKEAKTAEIGFSDPYGSLNGTSKPLQISVKGINFTAKLGTTYELDFEKGVATEKIVTVKKRAWIPGFEILGMISALGASMSLYRRRRSDL